MNGLLEFLHRHNNWLVFLLLEVISLVLLFTFNSWQSNVWLTTAGTVNGTINQAGHNITSYFHLRSENRDLAEQNALLQQRLFAYEQMADSVTRAALLPADASLLYGVIPATVVQSSVSLKDNYLTLDKGSDDGIRPDMGVTGPDGIVGVVFKCSAHYSLVIPILNSRSHISGHALDGGEYGYIAWPGSDPRMAMLRDLPRYADISEGDTIVTSGHSTFFPAGLTIGSVQRITPSADNLSIDIDVELATHFARLQHVFVIANNDYDERTALQNELKSKKK